MDDAQKKSEAVLNEILEKLGGLQVSVDRINVEQSDCEKRISHIENSNGFTPEDLGQGARPTEDSVGSHASPNEYTTLGEHLNGDYLSIKDAVNRVKLPGALSIGDVNVPMKGDAGSKIAFIKKNSAYIITGLKVLRQIGESKCVTDSDLDSLYTCLTAHLQMLQSEQSVSIVEGTGVSKETVSMFRFLAKNPSFSPSDTVALENAACISVAAGMA